MILVPTKLNVFYSHIHILSPEVEQPQGQLIQQLNKTIKDLEFFPSFHSAIPYIAEWGFLHGQNVAAIVPDITSLISPQSNNQNLEEKIKTQPYLLFLPKSEKDNLRCPNSNPISLYKAENCILCSFLNQPPKRGVE